MAYALLNRGACAARRVKRSGRQGRPAAVIAALLACAGTGCFSDPINRAPTVSLVMPSTTPGRKQMVSYKAQISDPDNDQRPEKTMWAREPAPCTGDTGLPSSWPPSSDWFASMPDATILTFDDQTDATTLDGSICLWVFVTDSHGAMNAEHLEIDPQDAAPAPAITVDAPKPAGPVYPLYSTIELSSGTSIDLDDGLPPLRWTWTVVDPNHNDVTPMACDNNPKCSFTASVPGTYDVTLAATDPLNKTGTTQPYPIIVDQDRPPCIQVQGVSPDFQSPMSVPPTPDDMLTIQTVADDGNPTPPGPMGRTHFLWWISSRSGVGLTPLDNDLNQLKLTGYNLGDLVKVRVEVTDGQPNTNAALLGCGMDQDICTIQESGCILRLTWSIQF